MRRVTVWTAVLLTLLFGACGMQKQEEELNVPDTAWGMTAEEVLEAFGATWADAEILSAGNTGVSFALEGRELFGEKTDRMIFQFIDLKKGAGRPVLCGAEVIYGDGADMESVLREMKQAYGETLPQISRFGLLQPLGTGELPQYDYADSGVQRLWGTSTVAERVPQAREADYIRMWKEIQSGLTEENWPKFAQDARLVTVIWSLDGEGTLGQKNALSYDAFNYVVYREAEGELA